MRHALKLAGVVPLLLLACKVYDPLYCDKDRPCTYPDRPFCDLEGIYPASEGIARTCIPNPFVNPDGGPGTPDAGPTDARACTETMCTGSLLSVCGPSGTVERVEECPLGCYQDGSRCSALKPSNGLGPQLDESAALSPVTLADGTSIDTDTGAVTSPQGDAVPVATAVVPQADAPALRVFLAGAWTIGDVRVRGSLPVAFVASGDIVVQGVLDASADGAAGGPGALTCGSTGGGGLPSVGFYGRVPRGPVDYPTYIWNISGYGGGSFGSEGGPGGLLSGRASGDGGAVNGTPTLVPLRGGCEGAAAVESYRGAGGGAVQLVSATAIRVGVVSADRRGGIHVGGGGGHAGFPIGKDDLDDLTPLYGSGGGGSGGGLLMEAPRITLDDGIVVTAAGGGGGGFGNCSPLPTGADSQPAEAAALGGNCPADTWPASGGNGATDGNGLAGENTTAGSAGSGGGGLGRIRINTANDDYVAPAGVTVRGALTSGEAGRR